MDIEIEDEFVAVRTEIRGVETARRQEIRKQLIIADGLIALDAKVEAIRDSG